MAHSSSAFDGRIPSGGSRLELLVARSGSAFGGLLAVVRRECDPRVGPELVEMPLQRACLHLVMAQSPLRVRAGALDLVVVAGA